MIRSIRLIAAAPLIPLALAGCAVVPDAPNVEGTPRSELTPVALGQPVHAGSVVVTPRRIVEDSRCPVNARCVWEGRLIVETRIDGSGWRSTANITLGETYGTHGHVVKLTASSPEKTTQDEIQPGQYRFVYEGR
ncbi:MAG: hypothetical protein HKO05_06470 [Erythrobacter sp.]|nr:hypothetical protein [Erythrobacter sp.]RZV32020.1 MAG: hypothetical protein EX262_08185 [Sphingomonadaceae bacterium]